MLHCLATDFLKRYFYSRKNKYPKIVTSKISIQIIIMKELKFKNFGGPLFEICDHHDSFAHILKGMFKPYKCLVISFSRSSGVFFRSTTPFLKPTWNGLHWYVPVYNLHIWPEPWRPHCVLVSFPYQNGKVSPCRCYDVSLYCSGQIYNRGWLLLCTGADATPSDLL